MAAIPRETEHVDAPIRLSPRRERIVALERARRRARAERAHERRQATVRFWALAGALLFGSIFLGLTIREQVQALFGL